MKDTLKLIGLTLLVSCGGAAGPQMEAESGLPCAAESREDGNYLVCGDTEVKIEDGADGTDGQDGSFEGYAELVELCPEIDAPFKESLFLLDGQYLAFLTHVDYKKQRMVVLPENQTLKSTDGRNIKFKIVGGNIEYITAGCADFILD